MKIEIDNLSGFCFGVVRAITEAENALREGKVCSLGDVVHNRMEVQRLEALGLRTVTHEQIASLDHECRLLIRAHGEPPSTYALARRCGVTIIDATCPVVAALQKKVVRAHEAMRAAGGQVVILGKRGHAEVVGLTGQVAEPTIVIEGEADLAQIDFSRPIYFLSQTTQSIALFNALCDKMRSLLPDESMLTADDTICRRVSSREEHLRAFAAQFDVVVFVCGRKSSNGRVLFDICRSTNPHSHNIEEPAELRAEWFADARSVGVCGATSTPEWLMRQTADAIEKLNKNI